MSPRSSSSRIGSSGIARTRGSSTMGSRATCPRCSLSMSSAGSDASSPTFSSVARRDGSGRRSVSALSPSSGVSAASPTLRAFCTAATSFFVPATISAPTRRSETPGARRQPRPSNATRTITAPAVPRPATRGPPIIAPRYPPALRSESMLPEIEGEPPARWSKPTIASAARSTPSPTRTGAAGASASSEDRRQSSKVATTASDSGTTNAPLPSSAVIAPATPDPTGPASSVASASAVSAARTSSPSAIASVLCPPSWDLAASRTRCRLAWVFLAGARLAGAVFLGARLGARPLERRLFLVVATR